MLSICDISPVLIKYDLFLEISPEIPVLLKRHVSDPLHDLFDPRFLCEFTLKPEQCLLSKPRWEKKS